MQWGVRVRNLPLLANLSSLSLLVTGFESAPGGTNRLVLHGMTYAQRHAALTWAQELQDGVQGGLCLW